MDLDFSDPEPTTLEYARLHGITTDYTSEVLLCKAIVPSPDEKLRGDLDDLADHFTSIANATIKLTQERLVVSKDGALLLNAVMSTHEQPGDAFMAIDTYTANRTSVLQLKQEVPILRTDHDLDFHSFGSVAVPTFINLKIPLESADVERGESLEWPSRYAEYSRRSLERAKAEKIAVSTEDLLFFQNAVQNPYSAREAAEVMASHLIDNKNSKVELLTPPLLPLSPPITPYIPSSPDNRLELLSDATDSTAAELKALTDQVVEADILVNPHDSSDAMLLDKIIANIDLHHPIMQKPSSPVRKTITKDLKVEGPLTPPLLSNSPVKKLKSVTFPQMIEQFIPDLPSNFESGGDVLDSDDSFMDFFKLHADEAMRVVVNEKLAEADTTKRVKVPTINSTLPVAPWIEYSRSKNGKDSNTTELDSQIKFIFQVKRNMLKSESNWRGLTELERDMCWSPFPIDDAKVMLAEKLHGEDVLEKMLSELTMDDIATSSTDLWKRDGLQILDEESDDEIQPADPPAPTDVGSLVRKRKAEMAEDDVRKTTSISSEMVEPGTHAQKVQPTSDSQHGKRQRQLSVSNQPESSQMFGSMFSASSALQNFMKIHGKDMQVPREEDAVSDPIMATNPSFKTMHTYKKSLLAKSRGVSGTISPCETPDNASATLPSPPPIPESLPQCSFIFSTTLLQRRVLFRDVENIYRDAIIIERDFGHPFSPSQEADLLLSPSTGLIFTTLQQAKQRALPGLPDRCPIKERILALQSRYERLIVLISEGLSREAEYRGTTRPVDLRDKEALDGFEKFSRKLDATVTVHYVRGGEVALARCIVVEMTKWGLPHRSKDLGDVKLLQDETTWELFLRRAGFNPYAAQVIIASLQTTLYIPFSSNSPALTESSSLEGIEISGLQAFIYMSAEDRVKRFQTILGGARILGRISAMLDKEWVSAKHGFRI